MKEYRHKHLHFAKTGLTSPNAKAAASVLDGQMDANTADAFDMNGRKFCTRLRDSERYVKLQNRYNGFRNNMVQLHYNRRKQKANAPYLQSFRNTVSGLSDENAPRPPMSLPHQQYSLPQTVNTEMSHHNTTIEAGAQSTLRNQFIEKNQPIEERLEETYRLIQQDADVQKFLKRFPHLLETQRSLRQSVGSKILLVNQELDQFSHVNRKNPFRQTRSRGLADTGKRRNLKEILLTDLNEKAKQLKTPTNAKGSPDEVLVDSQREQNPVLMGDLPR